MGAVGDLVHDRYELWANPAGVGANGGGAGGVGWLIRKDALLKFSRTPATEAPIEGRWAMWIRASVRNGGCVDFGSVYLEGAEAAKGPVRDELLGVLKSTPLHRRMVLGDINCDVGVESVDAAAWLEA